MKYISKEKTVKPMQNTHLTPINTKKGYLIGGIVLLVFVTLFASALLYMYFDKASTHPKAIAKEAKGILLGSQEVDAKGYIWTKALVGTDTVSIPFKNYFFKENKLGSSIALVQYVDTSSWEIETEKEITFIVLAVAISFLGVLGIALIQIYQHQKQVIKYFQSGQMQEAIGRVIALEVNRNKSRRFYKIALQYEEPDKQNQISIFRAGGDEQRFYEQGTERDITLNALVKFYYYPQNKHYSYIPHALEVVGTYNTPSQV